MYKKCILVLNKCTFHEPTDLKIDEKFAKIPAGRAQRRKGWALGRTRGQAGQEFSQFLIKI